MAKKRTAQDYLNAPIEIYKGFFVDSKKVLSNILYYACYDFMMAQGCDFKDAAEHFNISFGSLSHAEKTGKQLFAALPRKTAFVGISKAMLWDYHDNDKTTKEKACLLAHIAIRSVIGKKAYCKITNDLMLSRMDGSNKTLTSFSYEIQCYNTKDKCQTLRKALELSWGLVTVANRGNYCSYDLTMKALNKIAIQNSKSYKEKQLQLDKSAAKQEALQELWQQDKHNNNNKQSPNKPLDDLPF